jgi:peptidoglycan hydrolase-like protein with peptidoglycan-binding domain
MKKLVLLLFLSLSVLSCGGSNDALLTEETFPTVVIQEEQTTTTASVETTTTTSADVLTLCQEDNNLNTDFDNKKNIQIFLNKYGFDAGEPDGAIGNKTIEAIKEFQAYAGLTVDGDVGPNTISKMKSWTGCEEKINDYTKQTVVTSTTTTTIASSSILPDSTTTTTTIPVQTINLNYGYVPSLSLKNNELISIFKGYSVSSQLCGTPYFDNLNRNALNYFSNGVPNLNTISSGVFKLSSLSSSIFNSSNSQFQIQVIGNGDDNYKFYFIEPFDNQFTVLKPSQIITEGGLTTAIFDKEDMKSGAWFYGFTENGSGEVIKASGQREFIVDSSSQMNNSESNKTEIILITKNNSNITQGQTLSVDDTLSISYITENLYDIRSATTNVIEASDSVITLANNSQAKVNEILLIEKELMLVTSINNNSYSVIRGYLDTEPKSYDISTGVKVVESIDEQFLKSKFGYAVFRTEKGFKFQVPLYEEINKNTFSLSGCPNDRYSLEEITTFSWRQQSSSTVISNTIRNTITPLFDKEFVINTPGNVYLSPDIEGKNPNTGEFIIGGPRKLNLKINESTSFNFNNLLLGSSDLVFAEIVFKMIPLSGSNKLSSERTVYFNIENNNLEFTANLLNKTDSKTNGKDSWESEYKYIFKSISFYDKISKTTFDNTGQIRYGHSAEVGTHDVYYLDQFSFIVDKD